MSITALEPLSEYEIDRGKPMPSLNHGIVQANLIIQFGRHPDYRIASEVKIRVGTQPYTPDIIVYPRQGVNWDVDPSIQTVLPLLAVEIFSPRQSSEDVLDHVHAYLQAGVQCCWVVSPPLQTVKIILPTGSHGVFHGGVLTDPVTGIRVNLDEVFS